MIRLLQTYPDDNSFGCLSGNLIDLVADVCAQADYEVKVSLVGIGLALLSHVVRSGLTEVQPTHRHFAHCFTVHFDASQAKRFES